MNSSSTPFDILFTFRSISTLIINFPQMCLPTSRGQYLYPIFTITYLIFWCYCPPYALVPTSMAMASSAVLVTVSLVCSIFVVLVFISIVFAIRWAAPSHWYRQTFFFCFAQKLPGMVCKATLWCCLGCAVTKPATMVKNKKKKPKSHWLAAASLCSDDVQFLLQISIFVICPTFTGEKCIPDAPWSCQSPSHRLEIKVRHNE